MTKQAAIYARVSTRNGHQDPEVDPYLLEVFDQCCDRQDLSPSRALSAALRCGMATDQLIARDAVIRQAAFDHVRGMQSRDLALSHDDIEPVLLPLRCPDPKIRSFLTGKYLTSLVGAPGLEPGTR